MTTSPAPQNKRATQHREAMHTWLREQSCSFSLQAPHPCSTLVTWLLPVVTPVPTCMRDASFFIAFHAVESHNGAMWIPDCSNCLFHLLLSSASFKLKTSCTSITHLLFILSVCLPSPSLSDNEIHNLLYIGLSFYCTYK